MLIGEFYRRGTGAAFAAIHHDVKSGLMPVSSIALQMPKNSQGWPSENLKPACRRKACATMK
jgi:hypothetical protein